MDNDQPRSIELALQGGGAHGAFTWGVLDRFLADERVHIEGLSGTSAGAMNAAVLAAGMQRGGRDGAREALRKFWATISRAALASPIQRTPLDMLLGRWTLDFSPGYLFLDHMSRTFSPYDLNPLDFNPLRDLLLKQVDFDHVNGPGAPKVFVAATNVRTGRRRIFRQPSISADAVMASACLPFLYKAVEIEGEAYWDGGYMGNPALFPLVDECDARDLVIVQINPMEREEVPRRARDILNRLNEITFNASLIKDLRAIMLLKELIDAEGLDRERYRDMLIHRIHAVDELKSLGVSSKMNAEWAFLQHLHDIGWRATERWLEANFESLGRKSTFDLGFLADDGLRPVRTKDDESQGS